MVEALHSARTGECAHAADYGRLSPFRPANPNRRSTCPVRIAGVTGVGGLPAVDNLGGARVVRAVVLCSAAAAAITNGDACRSRCCHKHRIASADWEPLGV